MKTIKMLLFIAAASLADSAFAGWEGSWYYNDSSEAVDIGFGADVTLNTYYYGYQYVGVNVFTSAAAYEWVDCSSLAEAEATSQYYWMGVDYADATAIYPYYP